MAGLLVKVRGNESAFRTAAGHAFGAKADVETILTLPGRPAGQSLAAQDSATWLRVEAPDGSSEDAGEAWDAAHALASAGSLFADGGGGVEAVEPDLPQQWLTSEGVPTEGRGFAVAASKAEFCAFDDQDDGGGRAKGTGAAWNLGNGFSGLKKARDTVGDKQARIRIAHLDTGYDAGHATRPSALNLGLQRNFVAGENPRDATDQVPPGQEYVRNRGHGTGTLSLLAGNKLDGTTPGFPGFEDYLGGAPLADIVPVRIANWVVRFTTGTIVQGIDYARTNGAHVISMSMGGLGSQALADAVNLAYESGVVLVTAGGNNVAGVPTPKSIVFPARYRRVLAACGVMADGRAYAGLDRGTMQGNYGPSEKMATALGAYTPNVPWAQIACGKVVDMNGAGTSAATPQIAAAAALWLAEHFDEVMAYPEKWMRVEAVRHALFETARTTTRRMTEAETFEKIGQGVMNAAAALRVRPAAAASLVKSPDAESTWPWLNLIFGGGVSLAGQRSPPQERMLALELTQMAQRCREVDAAMAAPERATGLTGAERNRYLEAALDAGKPSKALRAFLEEQLLRSATTPSIAAAADYASAFGRRTRASEPPLRRLRIYALDPAAAKTLDTLPINETVLSVPWDDEPNTDRPLQPGPVGEYLEVVDIDPASGKVYEPVDLNDRLLLAQDGLAPSEGNPKFHQQMVYAVAMKTIGHFERALGRKALWSPRRVSVGNGAKARSITEFVPRLRIYPHALRTANAYYSPEKRALLFGYFRSNAREGATTAAGTMVFTCLSSDIVAHETSHALLDGLHRGFQESSNPDVAAFHEAFADIVALFQHFTIPELVRFEIGRSRGTLTAARLLSGLARQFGEGTDLGSALRDYVDPAQDRLSYATTTEAHDRGSILVRAVYDAFIAIVDNRTADLLRLATGGTGVLPAGALHPDLVNRLADETMKAARQVLNLCIRALDYCPSVDITFGDYLRALITADADAMPDDPRGYRVAIMEAFQRRGIVPRDVRTVSTESLTWNVPEIDDARPDWLTLFLDKADFGLDRLLSRQETFELSEKNRWRLWSILDRYFESKRKEAGKTDAGFDEEKAEAALRRETGQLGLLPGIPRYESTGRISPNQRNAVTTFEVRSVRPTRRALPDGTVRVEIVIVIQQRRPIPIDPEKLEDPFEPWQPAEGEQDFFWFRGGATLIIQQRRPHDRPSMPPSRVAEDEADIPAQAGLRGFDGRIRYAIIKSSGSVRRLNDQRRTLRDGHLSALQALYFGEESREPFAMMHSGHRGHHHG